MPEIQRAAHHALLAPRVGMHERKHAMHIKSIPVQSVERKQCSSTRRPCTLPQV